jgi:hypothetical protein
MRCCREMEKAKREKLVNSREIVGEGISKRMTLHESFSIVVAVLNKAGQ